MSAPETIGFVGIGNMGAPMVRCILKAGLRVRIFDAQATALAPFRDVDAITIAESLPALGDGLATVVTMLPDGKVVQAAAFGPDGTGGFLPAMARGGLVVDMSSSYPLDTRALEERAGGHGVGVVDAPVSGGVGKAVTGTLAIMAGGAAGDVDRVEPLLAAMGSVHRTGPLGSGHAMKSLNNYVSAAGLVATAEALLIGQRFGLDGATMVKVLNASTGRNNTTENKAERYMLSGAYNSGFSLALMAKDVGMAARLAGEIGVPADELAFVAGHLADVLEALGADADHTAVYELVRRRIAGA